MVAKRVMRNVEEDRADLDREVWVEAGSRVAVEFMPRRAFRLLGFKVDGPREVMLRWNVHQIWVGPERQLVADGGIPMLVLASEPGSPPIACSVCQVGANIRFELENADDVRRGLKLRLLGEELVYDSEVKS